MTWAWIKNFIGSEPSLDTKNLCLPQIQIGKEANIMFKFNGRLGRLLLNPSPSLLLMIQSLVQHMPKKMICLLWKDGVDSEALPRRIKSLQEPSSKVRSGKSVEKPLFSIGLISSCAYQFSSLCSPMQRLLLYMYLSQLMSTFTNFLKVHRSLDGYFIQ